MKKFFLILAALCAIAAAGCGNNWVEKERQERQQRIEDWRKRGGKIFQEESWYYKDWNVDVCYSLMGFPLGNAFSHAAVPCTEKVMAKIINKREKPCDGECHKNPENSQPEKTDQK